MNIINALKKYNVKAGELKRLTARIRTIDLKLDNWDKLKASSISDMPIHHDNVNGDKIGDIVVSREQLQIERLAAELRIAELNSFIIDIDSRIDCLDDQHRYVIDKHYRQNTRLCKVHEKYKEDMEELSYRRIQEIKAEAEKQMEEM